MNPATSLSHARISNASTTSTASTCSRSCGGGGEVIEELGDSPEQAREIVLLVEWARPLHLVVAVDSGQQEERLVTVYEPRPAEWDDEFKRRKGGS